MTHISWVGLTTRARRNTLRLDRYRLGLLGLAVLGALAGCVSENGSEGAEPLEPQAPLVVEAPVTQVTEPSGTAFLSEAELRDLLPATPVTTPAPGAVKASAVERQEFKAGCLREAGFAAVLRPEDNSVVVDVSEDQREAYSEASTRCRELEFARFGIDADPDLTKTFRALLYVRQCMIENGYEVTQPPSLETFIESHGSAWHPYDGVMADPSFTREEFQELEQLCPQDLIYLFQVLDFGP
ncbi:MAG: hypothetical protein ACE5F5_08735 [Acidimicrobiia bacterium]